MTKAENFIPNKFSDVPLQHHTNSISLIFPLFPKAETPLSALLKNTTHLLCGHIF